MPPNRDKSLLPITCGVLIAHVAAFAASFLIESAPPLPPPPQKLLVKTINLRTSAPAPQMVREETVVAQAEPVRELEPQLTVAPEPVKAPEPEAPKVEPEPPPEPEPEKAPEPPAPESVKAPERAPEPPAPEQPKPAAPKPVVQETKPKPKKPADKKPAPKPQPVAKKEPKKKPPAADKKPTAPKKSETPVAKKPAAKPATPVKKEVPTGIVKDKPPSGPPKPTAEEIAAQKRQQTLIAQAKENIAKIGQSRDKGTVAATSGLPEGPSIGRLESLHIDALPIDNGVKFTPQESNYRDELASRLKLLLSLPEFGEVRLKLTLDRNGKVTKFEVIKAENSANRKYVEKAVPGLKLPPFGNNFGNSETYTFNITLKNE